LTVSSLPSTRTSTSLGSSSGLFPMRDMFTSAQASPA
jgi:hypothetical protein